MSQQVTTSMQSPTSRVILNPKQIKNKVTVNCKFCTIEFQVWLSKYKTAQQNFNGNLYCSRSCARKNQPNIYDKFNWCDQCSKWIPKDQYILKKKGTINYSRTYTLKRDRIYCPHCNNELRTSRKW